VASWPCDSVLTCSRTSPISLVDLIARLIDEIVPLSHGPGHPPCPTEDVVASLLFFLREGVQWRELRAVPGRVSGATLRRRLTVWSSTGALQLVHARLIRMVRGGPHAIGAPDDVVVDSCSVRAKRGGDLVGPNPTDRGKPSPTLPSMPTACPWPRSLRPPTSMIPCCSRIC
jgi:hypothetical protein